MTNKTLLQKIRQKIKKTPYDIEAYEDWFAVCRNAEKEDFNFAHDENAKLRALITRNMKQSGNISGFFELYKKTLLFDAPHSFDCYLLYLEINRKPEERFYQPRRRIMKQVADALQELADDELDELFLSMPPRVGKLLADNTPILTTKGWKNHGDLQVGDYVFSPEGNPIKVLAVHPKYNTTHTVTLSDGTEFKCHFRHEWKVYDRRFGKVRMLETQEMIGHLENGKKYWKNRGHRYNFQIIPKEPLQGISSELPIAPYTLGAWLGDGTNQKPRISGDKQDNEIIDKIVSDGYTINKTYIHKNTGVISTEFFKLRSDLQKIGMCYSKHRVKKYIPDIYLTAKLEDRLELLAGLIDTDGCLRKKEHRYDFTTSEEQLKEDFISLVSTFGWRCSVKEIQPHTSSSGIVGKLKYWVVSFNPTLYIPYLKHLTPNT